MSWVGYGSVQESTIGSRSAPVDARFAFAVAAFADVLRGGQDAEHWSLAQIRDLARNAAGDDPDRKEFVGMIQQAMRVTGRTASR